MSSSQSINFFKKNKIPINKLFPSNKFKKNILINDVKPLYLAKKNDLTFFDSIKYKTQASNTKAGFCLTTDRLKDHLPKKVKIIIVKSVLYSLALILKKIYPYADIAYPDFTLKSPTKKKI